MSENTVENRNAVAVDNLPQFMNEAPRSIEIEEKPSWLNNNLHKLMIGVSVIWFAVVLTYITQFFGWDNLFLMMPNEFGGFLAGITLPLAIIWVVMAYIDRGTSFKQEAKFLRAYMNQLVYPEDGAPQTAKAMADAIRSQVVELQEVSKMATVQTAKIKDEIRQNINEFAKLVATLDNYSSKTIVELSDGVKYLTQNFETITTKAQNSVETFAGLNREFSADAADIEGNLSNLFDKLLPRIKEIKSSSEFLHEISGSNSQNMERISEMLQKYSEQAQSNLNQINDSLNALTRNLQNISATAVENCGILKKTVSDEVANMAASLALHTGKLERAVSDSGTAMRGKIDDLAKHAQAQIENINERIGRGLDTLYGSIDVQVKKVDAAVSKHNRDLTDLMGVMNKHTDGVSKKLSDNGEMLAQEIDKLMVRSSNLEDSISIQVNNLNNVSDKVTAVMQKSNADLENNIDSLQRGSGKAKEELATYIDTLENKTADMLRLTNAAMEQAQNSGDSLQNRREHILQTIEDVSGKINELNGIFDKFALNIQKGSDESVAAINAASENMHRFAETLNETSAVVVAQNQVSEASLAQQHKNITDSAARVEEIKANLKQQLESLSEVSSALETDATSTADILKESLSTMIASCNDVLSKSKAINDNLAEQAELFDTSANRTLAKVTQFDSVLNTQNKNMEDLAQSISERTTDIENALSHQGKVVNDMTAAALSSFRKNADEFDAQSRKLHEISRSTAEYTASVTTGLDEKAAALNTLFKQQEAEFYNFCDKISDNAESMSTALKQQVGIIEQSADKVFSRMVVLEEDTSRHTEAVVNSSHRSIDRLAEIEEMVDSKNKVIQRMVAEASANLDSLSGKLQESVDNFNNTVKNIDEHGKNATGNILDNCGKLQTAEADLNKSSANIGKLLEEHIRNIDMAVVRVQNQSGDINDKLAVQVNNLTEIANTLATQSRLSEASLAQQYKYLSDTATEVSQKMKEINDKFKGNTDAIFDTSTKLAYEFDVLGDRLIKAGEDVTKISKNSMKSLDQTNLTLSQTGEDLDAAVKQSVERIGGIFKEYEKFTAGFNTVTAETSTGVMEINKLISAQSNKMIQISDDTKKLVDCFNTVLSDTSNQLAERANQAYDKVKGLGKELKNLSLQMEDAAKLSSAHMVNSGDKLRAAISEISANAERISNDILGAGEVFLKQSTALVAATDDTVAKVNSALGGLLEAGKDFSICGDNVVKDAMRVNELISNQVKQINEESQKADDTLQNLHKSYQGIKIEGFLKQASAVIEKLESISVDINRIFNPKDEEDLWKKYYNGDTAIFVRYLAKNMTKAQITSIRKLFEQNEDFRTQINAYLAEFELLISAAKSHEHSGLLLSVISGADIGKLYYILAMALDKLN